MSHLLLISIGPVQEFIASARRSRDLWFGSWLLSELSKTAARTIVGLNSANRLIFPAPDLATNSLALNPGSDLNVANKIVAYITDEPHAVARAVEDAMYAQLHSLRDAAYRRILGTWRTSGARGIADRQIDDLLEYLWLALPLNKETDYPLVRDQLEALLAARKTTRDFAVSTWGSPQPKSSLDGQRESVIPERAYPDRYDDATTKARKIKELYEYYGASQAERLSGVDLLKRHGEQPRTAAEQPNVARFPSTSHIAALPLLARLAAADPVIAAAAWDRYWTVLEPYDAWLERIPHDRERFPTHPILKRYAGDILFEDRLAEVLEESGLKWSDEERRSKLAEVRVALGKFLHDAVGLDGPAPPYYALLRADGDRMGKVIDHQKTLKGHQALSQALDGFAGQVRGIVEGDHEGALVYAGGDDVLAFLPVHRVLECACKLAEAFKKMVPKDQFTDEDDNAPTLSVGVVVAHHLEPLSDTVRLSKAAEDAAKGVLGRPAVGDVPATPGKNALAITISKRSGSDITVAGAWDALYLRLARLIKLYSADDLAAGAAYELRDLAIRLWPEAERPSLAVPLPTPVLSSEERAGVIATRTEQRRELRAIMLLEAGRILARKEGGHGNRTLPKDSIKDLQDDIEQVGAEWDAREPDPALLSKHAPLARFADELIVAHELGRAVSSSLLPGTTAVPSTPAHEEVC